jgi:hypothetical protein
MLHCTNGQPEQVHKLKNQKLRALFKNTSRPDLLLERSSAIATMHLATSWQEM